MLGLTVGSLSLSGSVHTPATRLSSLRACRACMTMDAAPPPPQKPENFEEVEQIPAHMTVRVGDGYLAGDSGFDPLLLADTPKKLMWYREAEVKHARLAMLAAVGWPLSELFDGPLASAFGLPSALLPDGRVPSQLNGGLDTVNSFYWYGVVAAAIFIESKSLDMMFGKKPDDFSPGMLGYDLLGQDSPGLRKAEITNGRVAMVAIVVFALEEAIFKVRTVVAVTVACLTSLVRSTY